MNLISVFKKPSTFKDLSIILLFNLGLTFIIWLPFFSRSANFLSLNFSQGFLSIYRNFDGLEYVIIAKSFYLPALLAQIPQPFSLHYFPSHFPLYSIFIAVFGLILGDLKAMLLVSFLFTVFSAFAFYFLIRNFNLTTNPLYLTIVFLLLPARWVIVHSVGSAEPVFIFFVILTIYFFHQFEQNHRIKDIWLSSLGLFLTQLSRPPGILLFLALGFYVLVSNIKNKHIYRLITYYPLILGPLALLIMFYWFQISLGDFWAYFHSGDNIHLTFPPFSVFNKNQFWVGDIWLEDIIYIFLLGFAAGLTLLKSKFAVSGYFILTYLAATIFVAHRDIARYALPIAPFVLIAFEKYINTKQFKLALLIVGLGIYLYTENFLIANTAPYPNLSIFN